MKKNTIKLNESQLKKIVVESVKRMLTEHDDRIKKVNKIIDAEFGNLINLDSPVNGPEYYVNGNPETTWRQYLLFNLRHSFGLMTNADVQYLPTVARLAFSDEVGFDKRNDNGEQISKLNKVIQAFKLNPNFFLMAKNNPNMSLEDLYNRMGYMGTNMSESKLNKIVAESVKKVLSESIKNVDPNNVVPQDIAEQYGFKPEYQGFEGGLELWGKRVDFNPCEYSQQGQILLSKLGIKRFTSYNYNGGVRITVKPNPKPKNDYEYFDDSTGKGFGKRPMR